MFDVRRVVALTGVAPSIWTALRTDSSQTQLEARIAIQPQTLRILKTETTPEVAEAK